jgi:RimJ/RimL family protein N-acetyltransferase
MIAEEDFIDFSCPYCGEPVSFPLQHHNSLQQCPMCFEGIVVPEKSGEPGRKTAVPFSTERLVLRRLAMGDWKDLLEIMSDHESFQFTAEQPMEEEAILRFLESDAHVKLTSPDQTFHLGLTLKEGGKLIGYAGLRLSSPEPLQAGITIRLNRAFQRQGFALEALEGLLQFCLGDLKLHRVTAACDSRNTAAIKLLERLGIRREAEFLKDNLVRGEWTSTVWYACLREEYQKAVAAADEPQ